MVSRRHLLTAASPLLLSACGLHPLYRPATGEKESAAARELAAINVPVMAERTGQLMRQALQEHLERFGIVSEKRYDLSAPFALSGDVVGIDPTSNPTRLRYVASAVWTLSRRDEKKTVIKTGLVRVLDGVNIVGSQFFSSDQETDTEYRSFATTLADQIVSQLAAFFDEQARLTAKS